MTDAPGATPAIEPVEPRRERHVRDLLRSCFPSPAEARLVEGLRFGARPLVERAAFESDELIGHVLFSPATVVPETDDPWFAWALAPLAVAEGHRRRGVGAALVRAGLEAVRAERAAPVFVLGEPAYYARFGFRPAVPLGFGCPFLPPGEGDEAFGVVGLDWGRDPLLGGRAAPGWLRYHDAFDAMDSGSLES